MKKVFLVLLTAIMMVGMLIISADASVGDIKLVDVVFTDADGNPVTVLPENAAQVTVSATVNYENYYNPRHTKVTATDENGESYEYWEAIDANSQGNVALYAAHYGAANKLIGVSILTNKIFGGNNTFQTQVDATDVEKIVVLLWDGNTGLKPLSSIKKLDAVHSGNKILKFPYYEIGSEGKEAVINNIDNIIWLETQNSENFDNGFIDLYSRPNAANTFIIDEGAAFTQPAYDFSNGTVRVRNGMTCSVTAANGDVRTYTIYLDKPLTQSKMGSNCNSADSSKTGLPSRSGLYWNNNALANTGSILEEDGIKYWHFDDSNSGGSMLLGMTDSTGGEKRNNKFYKVEYSLTTRISDMKKYSWNRLTFAMGGLEADKAPIVRLGFLNDTDIAYASDGNAVGDGLQKYSLRYYHYDYTKTKGVHIKTLNVGEWVNIKAVVRQNMTEGTPKVEIYVNNEVVYSTPYVYNDIDASGIAGFPTSGLKKFENYSYSNSGMGSFYLTSDSSNSIYSLDIDEIWVQGSDVIPAD